MPEQSEFIKAALAGEIIVNIGQINAATERALNRLTKVGTLRKWRGHWFPVAGGSFGLGPRKTCWGLPSAFAALPA